MSDTTITNSRSYRTYSDGSACNKFTVDADGTVRAWDSVAGHYTVCHNLTQRQQQMIRAEARKQ